MGIAASTYGIWLYSADNEVSSSLHFLDFLPTSLRSLSFAEEDRGDHRHTYVSTTDRFVMIPVETLRTNSSNPFNDGQFHLLLLPRFILATAARLLTSYRTQWARQFKTGEMGIKDESALKPEPSAKDDHHH